MEIELLSSREEETIHVGQALGNILEPGDVVALTGDLGAGKTVFCKGVGEALGIPTSRIVSPSFTIVTEHQGRLPLSHIDVYRLSSEEEALDIGLDEPRHWPCCAAAISCCPMTLNTCPNRSWPTA